MKKQTGIWIDGSRAIIVKLLDGKENVIELKSKIENKVHHEGEGDKGAFAGDRHMNNEKKYNEIKKQEIENFLRDVTEQVKQDDELYVFGPADLKLKLKHFLENDKHLASKLLSVETADSMTHNQVIAQVKKFFEKLN